jgi:hypothetical protein
MRVGHGMSLLRLIILRLRIFENCQVFLIVEKSKILYLTFVGLKLRIVLYLNLYLRTKVTPNPLFTKITMVSQPISSRMNFTKTVI